MKVIIGNLRQSAFISSIRQLLPNSLINIIWHLPKSVLANIIYGFPSRFLTIVGVTGTKGKTTTSHLIYHILKETKHDVALISTISAKFGNMNIDTGLHVTNPNPFSLQQLLKQAQKQGIKFVILEVTSHGLVQFRNWGIEFSLGVFTNIRKDHISYHGSIENYRRAKAKLIAQSKHILVNYHDPAKDYLISQANIHNKTTTIYKGKKDDFESQNQEAALATASALDVSKKTATKALLSFPGIPGRMEYIQKEPFIIVIDFAHTPDSLEAALKKLHSQKSKSGKLIAVFGCAGDRDPNHRKMGRIAAQLADTFIITAEDPRIESVEDISLEIASYAKAAGAIEVSQPEFSRAHQQPTSSTHFVRIGNRQQAINTAIKLAKPGDVIGLFGKGHEKSMCFGTTEHPWSEHDAVKKALQRRSK